ncbi:MAG: hypothetical protein AAF965_06090 [Pseudomonadota bacterium]
MSTERAPLFVDRRAYYRRRMADAARLMPVLGIGLFMFPLFWIAPGTGVTEGAAAAQSPVRTVTVMVYLFLVWIGLAVASGVISRRLHPEPEAKEPLAPGGAGAAE